MRGLVPFLVIGVTTGSLYGLAGVGLVLTYRTSGVFNFAHGALGAAGAYLFFTLHFTWGWPWLLAALAVVVGFGPASGIVAERLVGGLATTRQATIVVATVGLMLFVQGLLLRGYGVARRPFPDFLPGTTAFRISGVAVTWAQVATVAVGTTSFLGLYLFLRRSRLGVAMRGVVAAPDLLDLTGASPRLVRIAAWCIGASFAALTGILVAPGLGLDAGLLSALVVQAFGAVAIGRFSSLPMTYLGGIIVGVLASVGTKYLSARPPLNGIPAVMPFLVLVVVLVASPARTLPKGAGRHEGAASWPRRLPATLRLAGTVAAAGGLLAVPALVGPRLPCSPLPWCSSCCSSPCRCSRAFPGRSPSAMLPSPLWARWRSASSRRKATRLGPSVSPSLGSSRFRAVLYSPSSPPGSPAYTWRSPPTASVS